MSSLLYYSPYASFFFPKKILYPACNFKDLSKEPLKKGRIGMDTHAWELKGITSATVLSKGRNASSCKVQACLCFCHSDIACLSFSRHLLNLFLFSLLFSSSHYSLFMTASIAYYSLKWQSQVLHQHDLPVMAAKLALSFAPGFPVRCSVYKG